MYENLLTDVSSKVKSMVRHVNKLSRIYCCDITITEHLEVVS